MPPIEVPYYLQPDFDPMRIKMDVIREILISHSVRAPTGIVKKQELIDLFEQHIRPQAPALKKYYENIVPSEEGIIKVPRSATTTLAFGNSVSEAETSKSRVKTRPSILSEHTRIARGHDRSHSGDREPFSSETARKQVNRSIKATEVNVESTRVPEKAIVKEVRPRKAKLTKEEQTGSRRAESMAEADKKRKARMENFSSENPFQSGSVPERRRRSKSRDSFTSGLSSRNASRTRRSHRKSHDLDHEHDHIFKAAIQAASFSKHMSKPKYSAALAEFDKRPYPNSPLLAKSQRVKIATLPQPKVVQTASRYAPHTVNTKNDRDESRNIFVPLRILVIVGLLCFALWYRQARFDLGFCTSSSNRSNNTHGANPYTKISEHLYPTCIPCPKHATCPNPHSEPICSPDYTLQPHELSFGGLLPLAPSCVLSRAGEYQSQQVADVAESIVHSRAGLEECRAFSQPLITAELLTLQRISLKELKINIESMKHPSVSKEEFDRYWTLAISKLYTRTDRLVFERGITGEVYVRSLKPFKPLRCRVRHALVGWFQRFKLILLVLTVALIGVWFVRFEVLRRRREAVIVGGLVRQVLERLEERAVQNDEDPFLSTTDLFVPEIHLRDILLADVVHSMRQELWNKVSVAVGKHSNVRVGTQELRGEIYRVWEWTGVSGALSSSSKSLNSSTSSSGTQHSSGSSSGSKDFSKGVGHSGADASSHASVIAKSRDNGDLVAYPKLHL
ncbi:inner nuclear membrane protein enriched at telomere/subtelomere region [Mortierella sp. GBA30]|nr:inner nuclear membrane protein enriched at telomere/subtelomere region [Mortierella sp. GBA30]